MSNSEMAFNSSGTREKSKMSTFSLILASFLVINTGMTPVSMCQRNITCPMLFLYFWAMLFSIAESASLLSIRQTGEYASTVMPSDWKYLTSFLQVLKGCRSICTTSGRIPVSSISFFTCRSRTLLNPINLTLPCFFRSENACQVSGKYSGNGQWMNNASM